MSTPQENQPKVCQCCGMPMQESDCGTDADGKSCSEYCQHCYKDGKFTFNGTLDEMIAMLKSMAVEIGMTEEQIEKAGKEVLPNLKRWKEQQETNNNTKE